MPAYPQIYLPISQYLEVVTTLQQHNQPTAQALSYWARWVWVKKGGELFQKSNPQDQAAYSYLLEQLDIVTQIKNAVPMLGEEKGKEMVGQFIASERKQIVQLDQSGDYTTALNRYQTLLTYLEIADYSQPDKPMYKKIMKATKMRMIEINKALQSGTPVPPNLSQSMMSTTYQPPMSNFPTQPSMPSLPTQSPMSNFPTQPPMSNFPTQPPMSNFPTQPPMSNFPTQPSMSNFPTQPSMSNFPTQPSMSNFPNQTTLPTTPNQPFTRSSDPLNHSDDSVEFAYQPPMEEDCWKGKIEQMIRVYYEMAVSIKEKNPKAAKALYETMARECRKNPQLASYAQTYEQEANKL